MNFAYQKVGDRLINKINEVEYFCLEAITYVQF
jgi:hypothetical protein